MTKVCWYCHLLHLRFHWEVLFSVQLHSVTNLPVNFQHTRFPKPVCRLVLFNVLSNRSAIKAHGVRQIFTLVFMALLFSSSSTREWTLVHVPHMYIQRMTWRHKIDSYPLLQNTILLWPEPSGSDFELGLRATWNFHQPWSLTLL